MTEKKKIPLTKYQIAERRAMRQRERAKQRSKERVGWFLTVLRARYTREDLFCLYKEKEREAWSGIQEGMDEEGFRDVDPLCEMLKEDAIDKCMDEILPEAFPQYEEWGYEKRAEGEGDDYREAVLLFLYENLRFLE